MANSDEDNVSKETINHFNTVRDEKDTMKILVATDIHLGYNETDSIRGNDSFNTFEEILQIASANNVDFILLGGDLFHDNKPSLTCYHKCISLLKRYCLGEKPVQIEFLSDQSKNFSHLKNPTVNYEDPNLNISIPVFSIHGNHDDPTGVLQLSAMDVIADTSLINYFGKWTDLTKINIYPLLIRKGETKLSIYGLSHIKDERLYRLFRDQKVEMSTPTDFNNWFNILVLHQNRAQNRGPKNYIPESVLPDFLDLVIWGHEHDCDIKPSVSVNGISISQPGSSVATSLAAGESLEKHVGLLYVNKKEFLMHEIKLNTVRPFIFQEMTLAKPESDLNIKPIDYTTEKITAVVNEMLEKAKNLQTNVSPTLPLLRLIVNFTDESLMTNQIRMGQLFTDKVANPTDMFSFKLKRTTLVHKSSTATTVEHVELLGDNLTDNINNLVSKYFNLRDESLDVLSIQGLCESITRYIDRNDHDALDSVFKHQTGKTFDKLLNFEDLPLIEEEIDKQLEKFQLERENRSQNELEEVQKVLNDTNRQKSPNKETTIIESSSDEDSTNVGLSSNNSRSFETATRRPTRGRGSRGPRRAKATGRSK